FPRARRRTLPISDPPGERAARENGPCSSGRRLARACWPCRSEPPSKTPDSARPARRPRPIVAGSARPPPAEQAVKGGPNTVSESAEGRKTCAAGKTDALEKWHIGGID